MRIVTVGLILAMTNVLQAQTTPQLLTDHKDTAYRKLIPDSHDGRLQQLRTDHAVMLYDDTVMPPGYQNWITGNFLGVFSTTTNPSIGRFDGTEPFGQANREFPWGGPFGTMPNDGHTSFKFMKIPVGKQITIQRKILPNVVTTVNNIKTTLPADDPTEGTYDWTFPDGTIFGEVLAQTIPDTKELITFEVRLRTRTNLGWSPTVYRPFTTPADLIAAVTKLETVDNTNAIRDFVKHLQNPSLTTLIVKNEHPVILFNRTGVEEKLAPLPSTTVVQLLQRPFQTVADTEWRTVGDDAGYAPSTNADFHIVPKGYRGYLVAVNRESCMGCHSTTLDRADRIQTPRDWYGRVRGSDNIFSFHPFEPSSISFDGFPKPVTFRRAFLNSKLLLVR